MGLAHIGAYSSMGSLRFLLAPLNPAAIDPHSITHINAQRCHSSGITAFLDWGIDREGPPCYDVSPADLGIKGSKTVVLTLGLMG